MRHFVRKITVLFLLINSFVIIALCDTSFAVWDTGAGYSFTEVGGVVDTDTTWNAENSPYLLTENIVVAEGVQLTIDPGVDVFLKEDISKFFTPTYSIQVDGILNAQGDPYNPIKFLASLGQDTGMRIVFNDSSVGWDDVEGNGSIISNSIVEGLRLDCSSSPLIKDNKIKTEGIAIITKENFTGTIEGNLIYGGSLSGEGISIESSIGGMIRNNIIQQSRGIKAEWDSVLEEGAIVNIEITNNTFLNTNYCLNASLLNWYGGYIIIQDNIFFNSRMGATINISANQSSALNSIHLNYNNINPSGEYTSMFVRVNDSGNVFHVLHNWWGTTDPNAIGQLISSQNVEVNYDPFTLEEFSYTGADFPPNPSARPIANAGPDQIVTDTITLDGLQSEDPDGGFIDSYEWQIRHRENPSYNRTASGELVVFNDLHQGFYDVILTVKDNEREIGSDAMFFSATGPVCFGMYTQSEIDKAIQDITDEKDLVISQKDLVVSDLNAQLAKVQAITSSLQNELDQIYSGDYNKDGVINQDDRKAFFEVLHDALHFQ